MSGNPEAAELRVAVIGLGKMGLMHAAMVSAGQGARVAALVDADAGSGSQARSMGIDAPFHDSVGALIERRDEIDAAVVSTPSFTHREIATACLDAGIHVLCEKPLAHSLDDARAMARAAEQHPDRVAAVAFMKGHYPLWLEAARRIGQGWIGSPRRFRATVYLSQVFAPMKGWTFTRDRSGGGILINSGIHLVHFLTVLFGDVARVSALARPMHSGVEDTLAALLEFRSGVFGSYDASWSVPGYPTEGTTVVIEGDEGVVEITDDCVRTWHLKGSGEAPKGWSQRHRAELPAAPFNASPDYFGEGYFLQVADFVRACAEGRPPRYGFADGLRVQAIVDAMYRSAEKRAPVDVPKDL